MIDYYETKMHPITKKMVLDAYKQIRDNGQAAGVDQVSLQDFGQTTTGDLWYWLNGKIVHWLMHQRKFGKKRAYSWLRGVYAKQPRLFEHWRLVKP